MLTILFTVMLLVVMFEIIGVAIKAAWGITKILFTVIFFPVIMIGLVMAGVYALAIPILIIVGIIVLFEAIV